MKTYQIEWFMLCFVLFLALIFLFSGVGDRQWLRWPDTGLYVAPVTGYKCKVHQLGAESEMFLPVVLVGHSSPDQVKVKSLRTEDNREISVSKASFIEKIAYQKQVKLYLLKLTVNLPENALYRFNKLVYEENGQVREQGIEVVYEQVEQQQDPPFIPVSLETNEQEAIFDMTFRNATNENITIVDVVEDTLGLEVAEKKRVQNGSETDITNQQILVKPQEEVRLKMRFERKNPLAAFEISPKVVYTDKTGKVGATSLFGIMYPGTADPDELIRFFRSANRK